MGWTTGRAPHARVLVAVAVLVVVVVAAVLALAANGPERERAQGIASTPVTGAPRPDALHPEPLVAPPRAAPADGGDPAVTTTRRAAGATGTTTPSTTGAATGTTRTTRAPSPTSTTLVVVDLPAGGSGDPLPLDLPATPCTLPADTGYASQIATRFTGYRAQAGLPAMQRSGALDAVALTWARALACAGAGLSHNPDLKAAVLGACGACVGWAENVAYDTGPAEAMWGDWLRSPPHLENIQDPHAGVFGVAVVRAASGVYYGVQDFGRYP